MRCKQTQTLYPGNYIGLYRRNQWEFVARSNPGGAVVIVATTKQQQLLFVEQYREPVQNAVIEFPAGLIGDAEAGPDDTAIRAAIRELEEETGFRPRQTEKWLSGPDSAGMSQEILHFVRAWDLEQVSDGGGVGGENITPHAIALDQVEPWLAQMRARGLLVDPRIYAGLYHLSKENPIRC